MKRQNSLQLRMVCLYLYCLHKVCYYFNSYFRLTVFRSKCKNVRFCHVCLCDQIGKKAHAHCLYIMVK